MTEGRWFVMTFLALLASFILGIVYAHLLSALPEQIHVGSCQFAGYDTAVSDMNGHFYCVYEEDLVLLDIRGASRR